MGEIGKKFHTVISIVSIALQTSLSLLQSGWTPLIIASSAGHENIVKSLLQRDANPNKATATGQTALHYAASRNRFKVSAGGFYPIYR